MATDRTETIVEAARRLFLTRGFRATTMEAIAREAGMSKPTLYARFADKESVLAALGQHIVAEFTTVFEQTMAAPGDPLERVRAALSAKYQALDVLLADSPHRAELLAEYDRLAPETLTTLHATVQTGVQQALTEAGLPDARQRAVIIVAAVDGLRTQISDPGELATAVDFTVAKLLS